MPLSLCFRWTISVTQKGKQHFSRFPRPGCSGVVGKKICCNLNLGQLPTGADRVLLVVYTFSAMGPVSDLRLLRLQIDSQIEFNLNLSDNGESAIIVGEFYCRNHQWKFRALAEGRPMA